MAGIHEGGSNITGFYGASFARFGGRAGWRLGFVWCGGCLSFVYFCFVWKMMGWVVVQFVCLFVVAFILFTCLFLEDSQGKLLD